MLLRNCISAYLLLHFFSVVCNFKSTTYKLILLCKCMSSLLQLILEAQINAIADFQNWTTTLPQLWLDLDSDTLGHGCGRGCGQGCGCGHGRGCGMDMEMDSEVDLDMDVNLDMDLELIIPGNKWWHY
jgi:hypothetical protein